MENNDVGMGEPGDEKEVSMHAEMLRLESDAGAKTCS